MKLADRFATSFSGLSPREQRLLGFLGVTLLLFVVFVFGYTIYSSFSTITERIDRAKELSAMLENNKENISNKFANATNKKERDPVPQLTSFLDEISKRKSVTVDNYGGEKSLPTKDKKYTETSMEVRLKKVTLQQLVDFLQEIESADEAAYTKSLEVNIPIKSQRDSFDVVMTVATYEDPNAKKENKDKTKTADAEKPNKEGAETPEGEDKPKELVRPPGGYSARGSAAMKDGAEPTVTTPAPAIPKIRPLPEVKDGVEKKVETPASKGFLGRRPLINKINGNKTPEENNTENQ